VVAKYHELPIVGTVVDCLSGMEIIVTDQDGLQQIVFGDMYVVLNADGVSPTYVTKQDWEGLVETVKKMKDLYDYLNEEE
jgi:hypothetical protein